MKYLKNTFLVTACVAAVGLGAISAQAAQSNGFFGYLDGMYALKSNGEKTYQGYFPVPSIRPGDGFGIDGLVGMNLWDRWDAAVAGGYSELSRGKESNPSDPTDSFRVNESYSWHVDGTVGYNPEFGMGNVRLFAGLRLREWKHKFDLVRPRPVNCCALNTKAWGIGPLIGFDGNIPLNETFGFFGGAELAVLFGKRKFNRGPGTPNLATGNSSKTMVDVGAKAGVNIHLMDGVSAGVGYKVSLTTNTTFSNAGLFSGNNPSGNANRVIHGPFARISFDLPK